MCLFRRRRSAARLVGFLAAMYVVVTRPRHPLTVGRRPLPNAIDFGNDRTTVAYCSNLPAPNRPEERARKCYLVFRLLGLRSRIPRLLLSDVVRTVKPIR